MMMSIFMSQATIIWSPIRTPKPSSPQIPGSNPSADRLPQALPVESGMSWNHNDFNCIRSICSIVPTRIYRSRSQIVRGSADDEEATGLWKEFLEYSVPFNYSMYGRYFKTIHLSKESLWTKFLLFCSWLLEIRDVVEFNHMLPGQFKQNQWVPGHPILSGLVTSGCIPIFEEPPTTSNKKVSWQTFGEWKLYLEYLVYLSVGPSFWQYFKKTSQTVSVFRLAPPPGWLQLSLYQSQGGWWASPDLAKSNPWRLARGILAWKRWNQGRCHVNGGACNWDLWNIANLPFCSWFCSNHMNSSSIKPCPWCLV